MKETKKLKSKIKETPILTKKEEVEVLSMQPKKRVKDLTLDDIEAMEIELIETTTQKTIFFNKQKLEMLDKLATQKLRRAQIEATILAAKPIEVKPEPIKVEFVNAKSLETRNRLDQLEKEVQESVTGVNQPKA